MEAIEISDSGGTTEEDEPRTKLNNAAQPAPRSNVDNVIDVCDSDDDEKQSSAAILQADEAYARRLQEAEYAGHSSGGSSSAIASGGSSSAIANGGNSGASASSGTPKAEDRLDRASKLPRLQAPPAATTAPGAPLALCWRADHSLALINATALTSAERWWTAQLRIGVLLCRERPGAVDYWPSPGSMLQTSEKRPDALLRSNVQKATRRRAVGTATRSAMLHLKQAPRTKLQKQLERLTVIALEDSTPCAGYAHLCW